MKQQLLNKLVLKIHSKLQRRNWPERAPPFNGRFLKTQDGRRAYRLEDLDAYVEPLPGWYDSTGEKSAKVVGDGRVS